MTNRICTEPVPEQALGPMKRIGGAWAAYENQDETDSLRGNMRFIKIGHDAAYQQPPERLPDEQNFPAWKYIYVGMVNTSNGEIA